MSWTGMPSVMQTRAPTRASAASSMASAAKRAGTKITLQLAPVAVRALSTVSNTGTFSPSTHSPPLPGVTPATTWVPYSSIWEAWKRPSRPVIPWTSSRVRRSARMLNGFTLGSRHGAFCPFQQRGGRDHLGFGQEPPPLFLVGANQPRHHGNLRFHFFHRHQDASSNFVAARDAAEDVEQHHPHITIR